MKVEELLSKCDVGKMTLERVQVNLERYKSSLLKAACEGRLVAGDAELARQEGRDFEPASALLERIHEERRKNWEDTEWAKIVDKAKQKTAKATRKASGNPLKKGEKLKPKEWESLPESEYKRFFPKTDAWKEKYKEPELPDTAGLPKLPSGWVWVKIDSLFEVKYGLSESLSKTEPDSPNDVAVIRIPNVTPSGELDINNLKYFPLQGDKKDILKLRKGDVLFNWRNAPKWIGRSAVFKAEGEFVNASFLLRLRPFLDGYGAFISTYLNYLRISGYFLLQVDNAVNQANFNASKLKEVSVPLPQFARLPEFPRHSKKELLYITVWRWSWILALLEVKF